MIIWDSQRRAVKGALGPAAGSRGMIDSIHHAAYTLSKLYMLLHRQFNVYLLQLWVCSRQR
jgi:hypothetical protein